MRRVIMAMTCLVFLVGVGSELSAQEFFKNVVVKAKWSVDPGFSSPNVPQRADKTLFWLQIDVDYDTVTPKSAKGRTVWLDDVTLKYDVLLPVRRGSKVVVLSGRVTYWSIALDGKTHHAQAFIHPRFIQRYAPELRQRNSELKDFRIAVTFMVNDSPSGGGVVKPRGKASSKEALGQLRKALNMASTKKVRNSIFPRNETPWGILNLNNYELIKRKQQ